MTDGGSICFGLLAGGRSSRMGEDKALLDWHGQPLWQHQLQLAGAIGADEILISGKPDGPYRDAARVVADEVPDSGPLAGLVALLTAMRTDWLVAVAVDMPLLDGETLRGVIAARREKTGVVPVLNDCPEPLAAIYPRTVLALAQQRLKSTDHSLQGFVREAAAASLIRLLPWPVEHADSFRSINTPAELAALRSAV
jgi:molybdopterin-guanine dinucleotide biosynthesis protein A